MRQTLFFASTILSYLGYRYVMLGLHRDGISERNSCLHLFGPDLQAVASSERVVSRNTTRPTIQETFSILAIAVFLAAKD